MLSRQTMRRPWTGSFQTAVHTVSPRQATLRGRPTFTESSRGIEALLSSFVLTPKVLHNSSTQSMCVQVASYHYSIFFSFCTSGKCVCSNGQSVREPPIPFTRLRNSIPDGEGLPQETLSQCP